MLSSNVAQSEAFVPYQKYSFKRYYRGLLSLIIRSPNPANDKGDSRRFDLTIQTRKGNPIPNEIGPPTSPLQVRNARGILQESCKKQGKIVPDERRAPTTVYNCHGMTFLNRRAGLYHPDDILPILQDDGYKEVELQNVMPHDIILYRDATGSITHTGIVMSIETMGQMRIPRVLSKWGQYGEYVHLFNDCPYYEQQTNIVYMREGYDE